MNDKDKRVEKFKQALFKLYEEHGFVLLSDSKHHNIEIYTRDENKTKESMELRDETVL